MGGHRRFFVNPDRITDGEAILDEGTARQISKVLRLREGDRICLVDGSGLEYDAEISALTKDRATARIINAGTCSTEPNVRITLAVCMPKADKLELIVQKCTELGIFELILVNSERTVARPEKPKVPERIERWRKIATEAAEQCGRGKAPGIDGIIEFDELMERVRKSELALVAWEDEDMMPLKDALRDNIGARSAIIIVGPEGGLTEKEVESARTAGAICVSLGRRILRTETAAIAMCAAVMYELEGEL